MDQSLDEIISSRPKTGRRAPRGAGRRGGAGAARTEVLGKSSPSPVTRARAAATNTANVAKAATPTTAQPADKIIVSNLPQDVNEAQVKELFHSTVGPVREVTLHYDSAGRSKGIAGIQFQRKGDGTKAYQQYNNRLIDGKRPMKIEIVVDPSTPAPRASLVSRVAPVVAAAPAAAAAPQEARTGARGGGGGRRGGRGRGGRTKTERPNKTAADLDAEMEDYTSTANNAPAAAAA